MRHPLTHEARVREEIATILKVPWGNTQCVLEAPGENAVALARATLKWRSEWLLQEIGPDHKAEIQVTGRGEWGAGTYFEIGFPYMNCELPDVQAGFRKDGGTRDQIANIRWIMEKAREF